MLIPNCHKPEFVYDSARVNEWRRNSTLFMTRSRTYEWAQDGSDPLEAPFLRFQLHYLLHYLIKIEKHFKIPHPSYMLSYYKYLSTINNKDLSNCVRPVCWAFISVYIVILWQLLGWAPPAYSDGTTNEHMSLYSLCPSVTDLPW